MLRLTTRRIYWDEYVDADGDRRTPADREARPSTARRPLVFRRAARYAGLPETVPALELDHGSFRLDLGRDGPLPLPGIDAALAQGAGPLP